MTEYNNKKTSPFANGEENLYGYIESVYTGSGVDGKGLRVVVFFSGCNLRCPFCHNPETLFKQGDKISVDALVKKIKRYKPYLKRGGVTLSGGEPFMQKDFALALINALKAEGISTCIETNGHIIDESLISSCEYIICDVKNQECDDISVYDDFLRVCDELKKRVELTNVLVPTKNDDENKIIKLKKLLDRYECCSGIRFLPFRKLCVEKYKTLEIPYLYENIKEAQNSDVLRAEILIFKS